MLISKQAVSWALTEAEKSKAADVVIMNVRMIFSMLASNELVLDGVGLLNDKPPADNAGGFNPVRACEPWSSADYALPPG